MTRTATRTAALWRLDETEAAFPPSDAAGKVAPLTPVVSGQSPAVVSGAVGYARRFASGYAFKGVEAVAGATELRRSMTVQAILKYTQNGGVQVIACRGRKTGTTAERRLWCVSIVRSGGVDAVRFEWDRSSGTAATVPDVTVQLPSTFFHLAVVRDWVSATEVLVTVFANGQQLGAAVTSAHGDVEDGAGGEIMLGTRWNNSTLAYDSFYAGDVDQVKVSNEALSAEEIQHEYRRMFVYPAECYDLVRSCLPPGVAFPTDPTTKLQRLVQVIADGLSIGWAKARELADYYHPDVAWSMLPDWERILRLPPTPGDRLSTRRARLLAFLRRLHGYSAEQVAEVLAPLLGLDAEDLPVFGNSNMVPEFFGDASVPTYWRQEPNNGTISQSAGALHLDSQVGDDARWTAAVRVPVRVETSVGSSLPVLTLPGVEVQAELTHDLAETLAKCGVFFYSSLVDGAHLFGIKRVGGSRFWYHEQIVGGVVTEVVSAVAVTDPAPWMRVTLRGDGTYDLDYRVGVTDFDDSTLVTPWINVFTGITTWAGEKHYTGLYVSCDTNPTTAANGLDVSAWRMWCPRFKDVAQGYVYRDPSLSPTVYDRAGAQLTLDKMRPAFGRVTIIESLSLIAGNPHSVAGLVASGDTELP